jgi:hypothetical protein
MDLSVARWIGAGAGLIVLGSAAAVVFSRLLRARDMEMWFGSYLRGLFRSRPRVDGPVHIMVCVADHYEPAWNQASPRTERARVTEWVRRLPTLADRHRDGDGVRFQYTFFFPEEQYRYEHLERLATLCRAGYGDVEIHLHHHDDTSEGVRQKLERFKTTLHERHGLLRRHPETGHIEYGFIHGDWALDNCSRDGSHCGVDDELLILRETGCYADFTLPSAPSDTQTRKINSIYYATDDPARPKSHDTGVDVTVDVAPSGDLLLIQGPLTLNWRNRSRGVLPRIENGEISGDNPPAPGRADLWVRQGIHVKGRPEWVFVKLHAHGCSEKNMPALLGPAMDQTLSYLERAYNDGTKYCLHYVTAREMYNIVRAAEAGKRGNPGEWRRYGESKADVRPEVKAWAAAR